MTTSSISASSTKSDLLVEIDRLNALLATTGGEGEETYGNRLVQKLWISDRYRVGKTQAGGLKIEFSGQVSSKLDDGTRVYGAYKNFVAYGDNAQTAKALLEGTERLVELTAFEKPWSDNSKRSDWVILTIAAVERTEPQAQAAPAEPAFSSDPTDEEVPF